MVRVADASVFATLSPPRLAGSRCSRCPTTVFPRRATCPRCGAPGRPAVLADRGRVWTWTVQQFPPKSPYRLPAGGFVPFVVGYVDLGDVLVESRLAVSGPDRVRIGLPVRLTLMPLWSDPDGVRVATYAFAPEGAGDE